MLSIADVFEHIGTLESEAESDAGQQIESALPPPFDAEEDHGVAPHVLAVIVEGLAPVHFAAVRPPCAGAPEDQCYLVYHGESSFTVIKARTRSLALVERFVDFIGVQGPWTAAKVAERRAKMDRLQVVGPLYTMETVDTYNPHNGSFDSARGEGAKIAANIWRAALARGGELRPTEPARLPLGSSWMHMPSKSVALDVLDTFFTEPSGHHLARMAKLRCFARTVVALLALHKQVVAGVGVRRSKRGREGRGCL